MSTTRRKQTQASRVAADPTRGALARRLLGWYARHGRSLPWRANTDPYRVWVAEIMLQQTQVETVIPYYERWFMRFPSVEALARAPQAAVLRAWEGLGYYARARNLQRAAQQVVDEHGGRLPASVEALRALPGVGRYTAGAIASIAFGIDAAALDGNVKRVLARVFDVREPARSPAGEKRLWELAASLVPRGRAGDYNQALMDLGAAVCTPRAPACKRCPLKALCAARRLGVQLARPVPMPRRHVPHREFAAGVVRKAGRVLIVQRPGGGAKLLGGLWAFPSAECAQAVAPTAGLRAELEGLGLHARIGGRALQVEHGFSHFSLTLHVFECAWRAGRLRRRADSAPARWVRPAELGDYPMGKMDRAIARWVQASAKR